MFIGHFAPAIVAATLPKAPRLSTLFIAAQLVDLAFFTFVLSGIENMRITPGFTKMNPMDLYDMPYTHSLLGTFVFAAAFAGILWVMTKHIRTAIIGGAVVVSHWLLDVLVHGPDMTWAGAPPKLGFGLWNNPLIEMPLELGMTGAAFGYYITRTRPRDGANLNAGYALIGTMLLLQLYNWLAPEPTEMNMFMPISALAAFAVFIWLAARFDRTRTFITP
jgi:hypothetical protein